MTGLIYVAIIAVWAVVLVPAWLRRHDHLDPERSVDRFSRTMQTLASRPGVLGIPFPSPQDEEQAAADASWDREADAEPQVMPLRRPDLGRVQGRVGEVTGQARARLLGTSAASRRRVVLAVLAGALLATAGLVVAGLLAPVALAVPALLLAGFLGLARQQVRAAQQRRSARPAGATASRTATAAPAARRPVTGATGETWEPRATPLPTYVTAPPAAEFPRVIDTEPGAWTAAAMLKRAEEQKARAERMAQAKAEAIARARAEQAAAEARSRDEEYLEAQQAQWQPRRRAVNE